MLLAHARRDLSKLLKQGVMPACSAHLPPLLQLGLALSAGTGLEDVSEVDSTTDQVQWVYVLSFCKSLFGWRQTT